MSAEIVAITRIGDDGKSENFWFTYVHNVINELGGTLTFVSADTVHSNDFPAELPDNPRGFIVDSATIRRWESVVEKVRAALPNTHIIVATASPTTENVHKALVTLRANDYIVQGINHHQLKSDFGILFNN